MLEIGKIHTLKIDRLTANGAYLIDTSLDKPVPVFMPRRYLTPSMRRGTNVQVFLYRDSEDRLTATTEIPRVMVGQLARLKVVQNTRIGAFLDWGLPKDLLLPFKEQRYPVHPGKSYLVAVYEDASGRLCATTYIEKYLQPDSPYHKHQIVNGTVYLVKNGVGVFVAVDNRYSGLIPATQQFRVYLPGEVIEARVINVRQDGKLDLSPTKDIPQQMNIDSERILKELQQNGGFLPLHDKSSPAEIKQTLNMSKKAFKRAVGRLMKNGKIKQTPHGLRYTETQN
ncbi:MAG: S1 RNA-binding domain-containing protein [Gemmatimonadetes bacterium]|nr:MAG: S1 RNA-binding domain-containing protein [Gemmatimonadota bacterium]